MADIPDQDLQDWQKFLEHGKLESKEEEIPDELIIDLHYYTLNEAEDKIDKILNYAKKQKIKNIKIITGLGKSESGYGKLYNEIPKWLEKHGQFSHLIKSVKRDKNGGALIVKIR